MSSGGLGQVFGEKVVGDVGLPQVRLDRILRRLEGSQPGRSMSPVSYTSDKLVVAKWAVLMKYRTFIVNVILASRGIPIVQVGGNQI